MWFSTFLKLCDLLSIRKKENIFNQILWKLTPVSTGRRTRNQFNFEKSRLFYSEVKISDHLHYKYWNWPMWEATVDSSCNHRKLCCDLTVRDSAIKTRFIQLAFDSQRYAYNISTQKLSFSMNRSENMAIFDCNNIQDRKIRNKWNYTYYLTIQETFMNRFLNQREKFSSSFMICLILYSILSSHLSVRMQWSCKHYKQMNIQSMLHPSNVSL